MNFAAELFPAAWQWTAALVAAAGAVWAMRTGPWETLLRPARLNLWLGMGVLFALLWSMKAGIYAGLNLHLLGAMLATLVFGPQLGAGVLALALVAVTLNGGAQWRMLPLNWLAMGLAPVLIAHVFASLVERFLPRHFFIFIFVIAFFGSAITAICQGVLASALLVAAGAYTFEFLAQNYLPYFLLLGFAEAWLSGVVVTLMVVYQPGWVARFDDRLYLWNK